MEADSKTYKGHNISIENDESPESPREWDNISEIHYLSNQYTLGDIHHTSQESINNMLAEVKRQGDLVFALYAYIHSGITVSMKTFHGRLPQGHAEFDSGICGFVVVRRKKMLEEFSSKRFTQKLKEKAEQLAQGEVDTFDSYLRGEVYGYIIDGDEDSCWGYYSIEDAMSEAESTIDYIVEDNIKRHCKKLKSQIKYKVPYYARKSLVA